MARWVATHTVWAEAVPGRGGESFASQQTIARSAMTFRIRWAPEFAGLSGVNGLRWHRRAGDLDFDIHDVRELGRTGIEIDASTRREPVAAA